MKKTTKVDNAVTLIELSQLASVYDMLLRSGVTPNAIVNKLETLIVTKLDQVK